MSNDLVAEIASETLEWIGDEDSGREDVYDEVLAYSLASFVDGVAITPRGYDDTDAFAQNGGVDA